jgi:hypothetical protein
VDADADGIPNGAEEEADTDPRDPASHLHMSAISAIGDTVAVNWIGGTSSVQYLERRAASGSTDGVWTVILTNSPLTAVTNHYIDNAVTNPAGFYRVRVRRPASP